MDCGFFYLLKTKDTHIHTYIQRKQLNVKKKSEIDNKVLKLKEIQREGVKRAKAVERERDRERKRVEGEGLRKEKERNMER